MRKPIIVMVAAAFSVAAPAQEVLRCVNPDVLNSLVFNARSESKLVVKRSMPDVVAGFGAPADFTLIGSGVRGQPSPSTVVAYKTQLESGMAFDTWLAFLGKEGWNRETTQAAQLPTVSVAGQAPQTALLCRNGERRNVRVQEIAGVRYATVTGFATTPPRACNAPDTRQNGLDMNAQMASINLRQANMPQFSFPATARTAGEASMGNANGSNTSSVRIGSPETAASLATQLATQLVNQGWRVDASWNGKLSTGSTWTRRGNGTQSFFGTLEILSISQGVYDIGFTLADRG